MKINNNPFSGLSKTEIITWLKEDDPEKLNELWQHANSMRREHVGDEVHLRGIIEISNFCCRKCAYCGISVLNHDLQRYRMDLEEIVACAGEIENYGFGTVVLQSGEDFFLTKEWIAELITKIKTITNLAVTLSFGERIGDELVAWKEAGADRYLLKIETGNPDLYRKIHPRQNSPWENRIDLIRFLAAAGYETGSGIMVGIPGQTFEDLADDLLLLQELNIDMLGIGPFIPHPGTKLGQEYRHLRNDKNQAPNSEIMVYKVNALIRILCPDINIPTTTALATINKTSGRELSLSRGANVIMPNMTPVNYRKLYEIYPGRICLEEFGEEAVEAIRGRIFSSGRKISTGQGPSPSYLYKLKENTNNKYIGRRL
ncbi:MAG: [FeFe] hydrogenase H-cluster radical SAM maturase HydE [Calditrichaceae bacterium]|nr:[FeFe] hydrogenase H-cluster radical SAM maturase HydE [Calditrichaceae bacterium]MBN2708664.1 [FeFe] hydrogenase H-cluster radical SAM maturase HydE [Calditrichaceae bacterium]RQV96751.1 MAG: [FeFe] hydrogenase H-cluster radical SAM maturase HydE [Calditrichota bacterium]